SKTKTKAKTKPKTKSKTKTKPKTKSKIKTKAKTKSKKTVRKCGICRKPDHDRRKCPKATKAAKPAKETAKKQKHKIRSFKVLLLPTKIDNQVLIRYRTNAGSRISIVCRLQSQKRTLHLNQPRRPEFKVTTPKLILAYDVSLPKIQSYGNTGYLFLSDKEQPTLAGSLKHIKAYFFPHVYRRSAYMCLTNRKHGSPRTLNNVFWGSSFYTGWHAHIRFGAHGNKCCKVAGAAKQDYQLIQKTTCATDTKTMRGFLQTYTDFFETDKKPMGVFLSDNKALLEKAGKGNSIATSTKDRYSNKTTSRKFIAGFAFSDKKHWWIYLKDGSFLKLTPKQVKIML
ncbi:MAG: hypothetical protein ACE5FU_12975, partial [Nitrospinota bacterium]